MAIDVNLLGGSPSIELDKGGNKSTYIRKENIVTVTGAINLNLQTVDPNAPRDEEYLVYINLVDGNYETFDIQDVDNQAGWTANAAGLGQALSDIAQSV